MSNATQQLFDIIKSQVEEGNIVYIDNDGDLSSGNINEFVEQDIYSIIQQLQLSPEGIINRYSENPNEFVRNMAILHTICVLKEKLGQK